MNLHGFERDFTADLERFVRKDSGWEHIPVLPVWSPRKTAAPERHRILGIQQSVPLQTQIHLLDTQNEAFEIIESMVRIYLSPVEYGMLGSGQNGFAPLNTEAEQVWLFAMRWLTHYYECLMEPLAIRTEFYQQSHQRFIDLMRQMLSYNPSKRVSFRDALKFWYPTSTVFAMRPLSEEDNQSTTDQDLPEEGMKAESSAEYHSPSHADSASCDLPSAEKGGSQVESSAECHNPVPAVLVAAAESADLSGSVSAPVPPSVSLPPPQKQQPQVRSRLALKRPDGPVGHNKTRRSPRNSDRSPAIGNRGTRVRG